MSFSLDYGQELQEGFISTLFVMHGEVGHGREGCTLYELFFALAPVGGFAVSKRRPDEEAAATLVTDVPRVKLRYPLLHLRLGDLRGNVHQRCQYARLVHAGGP